MAAPDDRPSSRHLTHAEYLIFCKVLTRQVRVYRVLHGAQRYGHLL